MTEAKRRQSSVVLVNAPTKELIRTVTPYSMLDQGAGEHYLKGFDALFCRLFLSRVNKNTGDAIVNIFTNEVYKMPKSEVFELMRGCGNAEAEYAIKLAKRQGGHGKVIDAVIDVFALMAQRRWREAAMESHNMYLYLLMRKHINFVGSEQEIRALHEEGYNQVITAAVDVAEMIFDRPAEALLLRFQNPHYIEYG